jgi:hypothetical protein
MMYEINTNDLVHNIACLLNCRFNDIAASVRRICVQISQELIVNHSELVRDIAGKSLLKEH